MRVIKKKIHNLEKNNDFAKKRQIRYTPKNKSLCDCRGKVHNKLSMS